MVSLRDRQARYFGKSTSGTGSNARFTALFLLVLLGFPDAGAGTKALIGSADANPTRSQSENVEIVDSADLEATLQSNERPSELSRTAPASLIFSNPPTDEEIGRLRILQTELIPIGSIPPLSEARQGEENRALVSALLSFQSCGSDEDFRPLVQFLDANRESRWRPALLLALGRQARSAWYLSRALEFTREAWISTEHSSDPAARVISSNAAGELADLCCRLGYRDELKALLDELGLRPTTGKSTIQIEDARLALGEMTDRPREMFRCGAQALERYAKYRGQQGDVTNAVLTSRAGPSGMSLSDVDELAGKGSLGLQMVRRDGCAPLVVPSIAHLRVGHFVALVADSGGIGRHYSIDDPTFAGSAFNLSEEAIAAESSGYFLVPDGPIPSGYLPVGAAEGGSILGRGLINTTDQGQTKTCDVKAIGSCGSCGITGMPQVDAHALRVSLNVTDTPVGYETALGPPVYFTLTYNQGEYDRNGDDDGPYQKWMHNWDAYVEWSPGLNPSINYTVDATLYPPGGGKQKYTGFIQTGVQPGQGGAIGTYGQSVQEQAILVRTSNSPLRFERRFPDGSIEVYGYEYGTLGYVTYPRAYLTEVRDPLGRKVTISYGVPGLPASFVRVSKLTDAVGLETTLEYFGLTDPSSALLKKVTDPFGRTAQFEYDNSGNLNAITDCVGLRTTFVYPNGSDRMTSMELPYETSPGVKAKYLFTYNIGAPTARWLEIQDPYGDKQRVEFRLGAPLAFEEHPTIPGVTLPGPQFLVYRNVFYWSKKQYAAAQPPQPGGEFDLTKGKVFHFLHDSSVIGGGSGVLESVKEPLEGRVWYGYPGQTNSAYTGTSDRPAYVARVVDNPDGSGTPVTQLWRYEYTSAGRMTQVTDPVGRITKYEYAPNGIDMTTVKQSTASGDVVTAQYAYIPNVHLVDFMTDAAGQVTDYAYDAIGRVVSVTNPLQQTTTFAYYSVGAAQPIHQRGRLKSMTGPTINGQPGPVTQYTYLNGQVRTTTDTDGFVVTFDHDNMDRPTKATFPDTTYEQITYDKLDVGQVRDRLGRVTQYTHDALRRVTRVTDAAQRETLFEWCNCGGLSQLTDPLGNVTDWDYDIQGRLTSKTYHDGTTMELSYQSRSPRLWQLSEPKIGADSLKQRTVRRFSIDDDVLEVSYPNALVPTPSVSLTYDPYFDRQTTMVDGTGTTSYSYYGVGSIGALRVKDVDGPLPNDTVTFVYDQLGRPGSRSLSSVATSLRYDTLGRIDQLTDGLGITGYQFDGLTDRVRQVDYPNGTRSTLTYYGNTDDRRLQSLVLTGPSASVLKSVSYADYAPTGRIDDIDEDGVDLVPLQYSEVDEVLRAPALGGVGAGDGSDTPGGYDSVAGGWFLRNSNSSGAANAVFTFGPPNSVMSPVRGDWDGNGTDTIGLYDPASGNFFLRNTNSAGVADLVFSFGPGGLGWKPVIGDWNGDAVDTVGLYDPSTGNFFLKNANAAGAADVVFGFGPSGLGWKPLGGDWNGDSTDSIGLYDPGTGTFYLRNTNGAGPADHTYSFGPSNANASPLSGDWDGDGQDTIGIYIRSSGSWFMRNVHSPGGADISFNYGSSALEGVVGNWDGSSVDASAWTRMYTYDDGGNRRSVSNTSGGYHVDAEVNDLNQVTSLSGDVIAGVSYDPNGNVLASGSRQMTWDGANRLVTIEDGLRRSEFSYDGLGRRTRIVERVNGQTVSTYYYVWSGSALLEERDASNVVTRRFFANGWSEGTAGATKYFSQRDHLGSVRVVTGASGNVVARYDYGPYGEVVAAPANSVSSPIGYAGYWVHEPSGLSLTWFRVYDPALGVWLSRDPMQELAGVNLYSYVLNNPVNRYDPLGLISLEACMGIGAAIGAGLGVALGGTFGAEIGAIGFAGGPVGFVSTPVFSAAGASYGAGIGLLGGAALGGALCPGTSSTADCDKRDVPWIPPPPPPPGGRRAVCGAAYHECLDWAGNDLGLQERCLDALNECSSHNLPMIFPDGTWVPSLPVP